MRNASLHQKSPGSKPSRWRLARKTRFFLVVLAIGAIAGLGVFTARDSLRDLIISTFVYDGSRADWELRELCRRFSEGELGIFEATVREHILEIARANAGKRAEVTAHVFLAKRWPGTANADVAHRELLRIVKTTSQDALAKSFNSDLRPGRDGIWHPLAVGLLDRVRQEPAHAQAGRLLSNAAVILRPELPVATAPDELLQIADLVQMHCASSPDLANFCEMVSNLGRPAPWTEAFEPHVRAILEINQDRFVRCSAHFALGAIVRSGGIERQEEAKAIYRQFLEEFDGKTSYPAQPIELKHRQASERILKSLTTHGLGMAAPTTRGIDLDHRPLSLQDYRGRVVLVAFWATWCGPCMAAIPHERELLKQYSPSDFAIFGMNADQDIAKAKAAAREYEVTWRSLQMRAGETAEANHWTVQAYPTYYLLNRDLVIDRYWSGFPPADELRQAIQRLIPAPAEPNSPSDL